MNYFATFLLLLTGVVVGTWCMSPGPEPAEDPVRATTKSVRSGGRVGFGEEVGLQRRPETVRMVTMAGADWRAYFKNSLDGEAVSEEFQEEIVALADELQEERSQGMDTGAPEVLAYTETIGLLLTEGSAEPELEW